jgi:hypothetical protein
MRRRAAVVSAAAIAPAVVLAVRSVGSSWVATGDYALIELRTRAVGTAHTPLVGPYSRFGWNHPGPAMFFALAAPYRLLGAQGKGLLLGGALIAATATVVTVVALLGADQPRLVATFGLLVVAALVRGLGPAFVWDPWNPYVIVLPFLALVLSVWWAASGEERALPVAAGLASFVMQTHVSLAPEAVALLALAMVWIVAAARNGDARRRLRRSGLVSLGVLAVMWALPIHQQFAPDGGNLSALWRFWTTSHGDTVGFASATRLLTRQLSIPAPWLTGHDRVAPFSGAVVAPHVVFPYALVVLLVAAIVAWRRRDRAAIAACTVAATVTVVAWVSIARIVGEPFPYLLRWTWVVGATIWIAAGIALLPPIARRLGATRETWTTRVLAVGAGVLLVVVTIGAWSAKPPSQNESRAARVLTDRAIPILRRLPGPVFVTTPRGGYQAASVLGGVIAVAVEHGVDARYDPSQSTRAGAEHVIEPRLAASLVFVAVSDDVALYSRDPAYRTIAHYDTLDASERREYSRLNDAWNHAVTTLDAEHLKAYLTTHDRELHRLAQIQHRAYIAAIFVRIAKP